MKLPDRGYQTFLAGCRERGIQLARELFNPGEYLLDFHSDFHSLYPDPFFAAINTSADLINRGRDLSSGTIPNDVLPEPQTIAQRTLLDIINAQKSAVTTGIPGRDFNGTSAPPEDNCHLAEYYFDDILSGLDSGHRSGRSQARSLSSIIVSPDGTPVIIQKFKYAKTGLTLVNITHNGIPYPAGTIVSVKRDPLTRPGRMYPSQITPILPLRLSAFAVSPNVRGETFPQKGLAQRSIEEIFHVVEKQKSEYRRYGRSVLGQVF